jgi:hypothetical protein
MIQENSDPIALTAQADIQRFYISVINPALTEFAPGPDVTGAVAPDLDTGLDMARAHTHNALCWEMRRTFGLTIGAMFERQLRFWLASRAPERRDEIEEAPLPKLKRLIGQVRGVTLEDAGVADDVRELWRVANAVRHGEGWSLRALANTEPKLWAHLPANALETRRTQLIGDMRLKDSDLQRYTLAVMKFWWSAGASSVPAGLSHLCS